MDDEPYPLPRRVVACAYLLAALCLILPLSAVGAGFAAIVLMRRGNVADGAGVIVVTVLATVLGLVILR